MLLAALVAAGCRGFSPPGDGVLQRLSPMPIAVVPPRFELELGSPALTGTFDAVFAAGAEGFRLQLFPDVGGKILDLEVSRDRICAEMPGDSYVAVPPFDAARPHLALVLAAVFAELLAPVDASRALGERAAGEGRTEVLLRPALGSGQVIATVGARGVEAYAITLGRLAFELRADGSVIGRGLSAQLGFPR